MVLKQRRQALWYIVGVKAVADRVDLVARGDLLWIQPACTVHRYKHSRSDLRGVLRRVRRLHNIGARPPICRRYPNSQRPDDKHVARSRQGQPLSGRVKRPILLVARGF